jgi:hypothetical protein
LSSLICKYHRVRQSGEIGQLICGICGYKIEITKEKEILEKKKNETWYINNRPYHVKTINMNHHLSALEIVELLTNGGLLLRREPRPRSVGSPVIILSIGYFDIVVEPYDLFRQAKSD